MKRSEITINGKEYPVEFTLGTMLNLEHIINKSFFECNFNMLTHKVALICAAVIAADEDTKLKVEMLHGSNSYDDLMQINRAFEIVFDLAKDFFPKQQESSPENRGAEVEEGDKKKN